ncbi:MAG: hypothetical protein CMN32_04155 [Saprospirales bacterium]|nr:hypothetical protein [Saprospirales bacterium]
MAVTLIFIMVFSACGGNNENSGTTANEPPNKRMDKRIFIVLDNSGSVNRTNLELINECTDKILKKLKGAYKIYLFTTDVTDRSVQHPTAKLEVEALKSSRPSEREKHEKKVDSLKQIFIADISGAMESAPDKTCILSSIKSAYNFIQTSEEYENYLLILSDMLECCKYGCPSNPEGFEKLTGKISSYQLSEYPLDKYIPLENIAVVFATKGLAQKQGELMESPQFKSFWDSAFKEMGYEKRPVFGPSYEHWLNHLGRLHR